MLRSTIKNTANSTDFDSITNLIFNSKEKLYKKVKQREVRNFNNLQDTPTYHNSAVPERISKKWVINLASRDLTPGKIKLLQRGPKFAVTSPKVPFTEYIAVTKQICDRLRENTDGLIAVNITKKPRIYSWTTNKDVHPILTSPKSKWKPSKLTRKMTVE